MNRMNGLASLCALLGIAGLAAAQCDLEKLVPSSDKFGEAGAAVAVGGGLLLVGEPGLFGTAAGSGRIASYRRAEHGGWVVHGHMNPPQNGTTINDHFGTAVAISGVVALGGAPYAGGAFAGGAYFYESTQSPVWTLRSFVEPSDGQNGDLFGAAVAIDGEHAVIGAPLHHAGGTADAGAAYFYKKNPNGTWSPNGKVFETNAAFRHVNDRFGSSVAMHGDLAVVGCPDGHQSNPAGAGWVRIYQRVNDVWTPVQTLTAPGGGAAGDDFGRSVSIDGEHLIVGAPDTEFFQENAGKVYIYERNGGTWQHDSTHASAAPTWFGNFGRRVIITHGRAAVSTLDDKVHLFSRSANTLWTEIGMVEDPDGGEFFGADIATDGVELAIGDPEDSEFAEHGGAAYCAPFGVGANLAGQGSRLRVGDVFYACTDWATNDGSATCGQSNTSKDVWYVLTVEAPRIVAIDTLGSDFDTVLSVHANAPGNAANQIVCNDDAAAPERWSRVNFTAQPGMFYFVRVAGFQGASGEYRIRAVGSISCPGDADGDGEIGFTDLNLVLSQFNTTGSGLSGDLDLDGDVDFADLNLVISAFNTVC